MPAPDLKTTEGQNQLLARDGPACLVIKARLKPVAGLDRFQPAGFPEVGHVIYDAPPKDKKGVRKVCIVDSAASMANHLEAVCLAGPTDSQLHDDLTGLPYVVCVTDRNSRFEGSNVVLDPSDPKDRVVATSLTEGHRIASDYFLDGLPAPRWVAETKTTVKKGGKEEEKVIPAHWEGDTFRDLLRREFEIIEVIKDKTYFIPSETWWSIYRTIFKFDPNSLVHGVLFAKEQIKISRLLTAHHEAIGASRVGRSGVKFDRLGKTTSGQPIFAVDEETAEEIRATFIFDLALLRSYGRGEHGLSDFKKQLLLNLALWKVRQLLARPWRYRTGCHLVCEADGISWETESDMNFGSGLPSVDITSAIRVCEFGNDPVTRAYYPADKLFKPGKEDEPATDAEEDETASAEEGEE